MNLTKRGVLYIGYACNLACKFCYYHYTGDKTWKKLYKAKIEAFSFRHFYGNNKVDITGGEPTIYPHINNLVKYCTKIGIRPSIITNGIALAKEQKVVSLKEAGVCDYLVSVHGLGEVYNSLTCPDIGLHK